jgi:hypothetical protein
MSGLSPPPTVVDRVHPAIPLRNFLTSNLTEQWCFQQLHLSDNGEHFCVAIRSHTAIALSDGSYKDGYGTAAWVLEGENKHGRISGAAIVPGEGVDHSSYRSEVTGLYCIILVITRLFEYHKVEEGTITVGCDGQSALVTVFSKTMPAVTDSCYDLLSNTFTLLSASSLCWVPLHVKGHQDDDLPSEELDRWSLLNIEMDSNAKKMLKRAQALPRHYTIPHEAWSVWLGGVKLTTKTSDHIYDLVHGPAARRYWGRKGNFPDNVLDNIAWDLLRDAHKGIKQATGTFIKKHSSGMCGFGKFMHRWKKHDTPIYPRCDALEDAQHVWLCKGHNSREVWDRSLASLWNWMVSVQTDPDIQHHILGHLCSWWDGSQGPAFIPPGLQNAIDEQNNIGWNRFLEGWLSKAWVLRQQQYFEKSRTHRSGKRWAVALIRKLWLVTWDLWEHHNGVLHEQENALARERSSKTNSKVCDLFQELMGRHILPRDRHLLRLSLSELLKKDQEYKEVWVLQATEVLKAINKNV